jgi:hypothetical protein
MVSMFEVLRVIIDDKSLSLFETIALSSANTDIMINRLGLTKKQYYPRIYDLRKAGLIRRSNTKYYLTSLGKIVYEVQLMIGKAVENYWKLRALDSFKLSSSVSPQLPAEEYNRVIDNLLEGNNEMKEILHRYNNKNNDISAAQKEKVYTQ